ncbi:MAG: 4Fe-4S dicluster domain-containing protein [Hyphomicrobiaceae bacterium]
MPLDEGAIRRGCHDADVLTARQLCRTELDRFRAIAGTGMALTVACTQEAPLFTEVAPDSPLSFANLRETGGWSDEAAAAGPKMAALLAAAAEPVPPVRFVSLASEGAILIYGRDEQAIEAGRMLAEHLDVTELIAKPRDITPPRITDFPVVKGKVRLAKGHLGEFEVTVDDYAAPAPSSRAALAFGPSRDGAVSRCDILLDLSGDAPLFPAHDLREGYLRADPGNPADLLRAVFKARDLVGTFDKPLYVSFNAGLCAHSRSGIVGCRRCLDLCPTGAIAPAGDHVAIDASVCAGCGQCAAVCPSGAAGYALPPADALMRRLRTLLTTYRKTGGKRPVVFLHDEAHGTELIDALARHGNGLPADVLPLAVNEVTQVGLETVAAAFAYGASALRVLQRARPWHDPEGLRRTLALAEPILTGLGFAPESAVAIETDDPDALGEALRTVAPADGVRNPASFMPVGGKREVLNFALRELHRVAPVPVDVVPLPAGAPFGTVEVEVAGCTLCLACVAACPTGALRDDPDRPTLRFAENACIQCGLCQATCPEKVISLKARIDFTAATAPARLIKQEEPFLCVSCGKPFGTRSTIERVVAKLEDRHWMFKGSALRLEILKMCEDCRVAAVTQDDFSPYGAPRPNPRTTEDYLREREEQDES